MLHTPGKFFNISALFILLYTASGCGSGDDQARTVYDNYRFDTAVINKLPLYDSLASAISDRLPVFHKYIDTSEGYKAFRFMPAAYETGVYRQLPPELDSGISPIYKALGENFIFGFDVFKDSTIKIYIRTYPVKKTMVDIAENLGYYPVGTKMKQREFPVKDTILNQHWQYWARLDQQGLF